MLRMVTRSIGNSIRSRFNYFSVILKCRHSTLSHVFPYQEYKHMNSRVYLFNFNIQHSRLCTNFSQSQRQSHSQSGPTGSVNRKYLLWATYVSFGIGACLFIALAKSYSGKVVRRSKGIEDERSMNGRKTKFIRYKGVVLPKFAEQTLDKLKTFKVRTDDVWIVSFPRSGTTWAQEIVYMINSNLDIVKAKSLTIDERFPYLEYLTPGLDVVDNMPSPRYIKTHMPLKFLPEDLNKAKVIYVARNPKDTSVSYYHFAKMLKTYDGEFGKYLDQFVNSKVAYSPWSDHVLDFWNLKDDPNVLFLTYEDMIEDLEGSIKKVAHFLNKDITDKDVKLIAGHCSFDNMKNNEQVNYEWMRDLGIWDKSDPENTFLRKGKVGQWRKYFDEEMNYKMNRMVALKLNASDLHFKYDVER